MRATVRDTDEEDVTAIHLEEDIDPASPQDVYDRLPQATPSLKGGCSTMLWSTR